MGGHGRDMSNTFHEYALEQLGRVVPITSRNMFGGVGIYSANLFFALMDDDSLYFKVDGSNRGDYEDRGLSPSSRVRSCSSTSAGSRWAASG